MNTQARMTSYVHNPLPATRWIRVLMLQPASNLEDALSGTFETVPLGESLPSEPAISDYLDLIRQEKGRLLTDEEKEFALQNQDAEYERLHAQYQRDLKSRRLCYDALSYTWATENGDATLSHSIMLDGRSLNITQNLAEGLRRLRSCTSWRRLWVDAVCINQNDPNERTAQVAMMFDIYKLAQNVVIWLGEGVTSEENCTAWQLSTCIHNAWGRIGFGVPSEAAINSMLIEAADAILRIQTCKSRQIRMFKSHSENPSEYIVQTPVTAPTTHESLSSKGILGDWLDWLVADASRLPRLLVRLETLSFLVERTYWKRRWIIQENLARASLSDGRTIHWGKYSAEARTLLVGFDMMCKALLSLIRWKRKDMQLDRVTFDSFSCLVTSMDRILNRNKHQKTDLLSEIIKFRDLQCTDPRDRLYSILAFVPGHHLQADYTVPFETVCIRFAKSMIGVGDMRVLYHAGDANNDPLMALPSWVPDLHGYHAKTPWSFQSVMADTRYCLNVDMSLRLDVLWIGDIVDEKADEISGGESCTSWTGCVRRNGATLRVRLRFESRRAPRPSKNDIICMPDLPPSGDRFLWLRRVDATSSACRLVVAGDLKAINEQDPKNGPGSFLVNEVESVQKSKFSVTIH